MNILSRIWPWSKIQRLEKEVENQRFYHSKTSDFAAQCLAYIDHLEPDVQHFRFQGKLFCMGVDYCKRGYPCAESAHEYQSGGIGVMNLYIICDKNNAVMSIDSVPIFGEHVSIPAIFNEEEDALAVLFKIESLKLTDVPHMVHKITGGFTAVREML
jgi:hypothetical protein